MKKGLSLEYSMSRYFEERAMKNKSEIKDKLVEMLRKEESGKLGIIIGSTDAYSIWTSDGWDRVFDERYKGNGEAHNLEKFYAGMRRDVKKLKR